LWILDVALPVGSALKDDGKGEKPVLEGKKRKVDCFLATLLAMTLADKKRGSRKTAPILFYLT
jgi:hypothetical protein